MTKRMTVVFHDEDLYTYLKVEAARRHKPASNIIAEAVREWLENGGNGGNGGNAELLPVVEAARAEWQEKGRRPWAKLEQSFTKSL